MGNKCKFCVTRYGGNKFAGGLLVGLCGCGRCNGNISARELKLMKAHYKNLLELTEKDKANLDELIKEYQNNILELEKIQPINDQ